MSGSLAEILRNSWLMFVRTALEIGVNFALAVTLARTLGERALGTYVFASSLAAVVYAGCGLGMNAIVTREVARVPGRQAVLLANGLAIRLCVTLPLAIMIVYSVTRVVPLADESRIVVIVVGLGIGIGFVTDIIFSIYQGMRRFEYYLIMSAVHKAGILSLGLGALWRGGNLLAVVGLFGAMQVVTLMGSLWLVRREVSGIPLQFDLGLWRSLLRQSVPLAFAGVSETVSNRSDSVLIGMLTTEGDVGMYGAAYNLYLGLGFLMYSVVAGSFPSLSRGASEGLAVAYSLFKQIAGGLVVITGIVAMAGYLLAEDIVGMAYGPRFSGASRAFSVLMAALIFFVLNRLCVSTLTSMGLQNAVLLATGTGSVLNLGMNVIMIPRIGYLAAAYSTAATEGLVLVICYGVLRWRLAEEKQRGEERLRGK